MKKLVSTSALAVTICLLFQTMAFAQQNVKLGVGIAYDGEVETAGIQANATFRVSERLGIAPNVTIYFPDDDETGFDSYMAFNLDGHFMIDTGTEYHIYALGGLNLTSVEVVDESETSLGLNLGLGGEYHLDNFSLYSDLKYVISDFDRVVLAVGVRFPI